MEYKQKLALATLILVLPGSICRIAIISSAQQTPQWDFCKELRFQMHTAELESHPRTPHFVHRGIYLSTSLDLGRTFPELGLEITLIKGLNGWDLHYLEYPGPMAGQLKSGGIGGNPEFVGN